MFNKKENIENDFMGYNTNSSEKPKEESGGLGSIIQFLLVIILLGVIAVGGKFGYEYMQKNTPKISPNIAKSNTVKKQPIMYTQEQVEDMVQIMMEKMKQESIQTNNKVATQETNDNNLVASLGNIQVDQMEDFTIEDLKESDTTQTAKNNSDDKIDRYNKVTVDKETNSINDLASQINSAISNINQTNRGQSNYTKSISNEVTTRENEMRVIVVKQGDSLSLIAKRAYGSVRHYNVLMEANPDLIKNPNRIYVGQRLRAPSLNIN